MAAEAPSPVTPATATARTEPTASEGKVDGEEWVTVFGFSLRDTNLVLREFEKCGVILRHHSGPREGNWIHILYQHSYDARKALQKNGIQLSSGVIIGVKHIDPTHRQQLDDRFTRINQGGFMVSLPSKSLALKSTGASNQLGALPRPYDPKSSTNVVRDAGRRTTGSVAAPAKSIVTNVMDLIFGIFFARLQTNDTFSLGCSICCVIREYAPWWMREWAEFACVAKGSGANLKIIWRVNFSFPWRCNNYKCAIFSCLSYDLLRCGRLLYLCILVVVGAVMIVSHDS